MRGDKATAHDGAQVVLVDIGTEMLIDTEEVRVWEVALDPGGHHPWHQHHNPYVVFSIAGSTGRMDWLDGRPSRYVEEYPGGAVFRPISPIHCLTNTSQDPYRSRIVELKYLGENHPDGTWDVGDGARSEPGQGESLSDGRTLVLATEYVSIWTVDVPAGASRVLTLEDIPHVVAQGLMKGTTGELRDSVLEHPGGTTSIVNDSTEDGMWFVLSLNYLTKKGHYQ